MELSTTALALLALTAFFTGVSKTGLPGVGIVFVVLVPMVMPAKISTGYILPFLLFGDIMALIAWRKEVVWSILVMLLPAMCIGVVAGYFIMDIVSNAEYGKVLGGVVLILVTLEWARKRFGLPIPVGKPAFGYGMGFIAGVLSMLANAAGTVTMIYYLAMNIPKEKFLGTRAWQTMIVNSFKIPFSMSLGLVTQDTLKVNLMMVPFVILGGLVGLYLVRRISGKVFDTLMRTFAFLGGLKLFFQ